MMTAHWSDPGKVVLFGSVETWDSIRSLLEKYQRAGHDHLNVQDMERTRRKNAKFFMGNTTVSDFLCIGDSGG